MDPAYGAADGADENPAAAGALGEDGRSACQHAEHRVPLRGPDAQIHALAADEVRQTRDGYDDDVSAVCLTLDGAHKKNLPKVPECVKAFDVTAEGEGRWRTWDGVLSHGS